MLSNRAHIDWVFVDRDVPTRAGIEAIWREEGCIDRSSFICIIQSRDLRVGSTYLDIGSIWIASRVIAMETGGRNRCSGCRHHNSI